jgi:Transglutaminase-like superfamily
VKRAPQPTGPDQRLSPAGKALLTIEVLGTYARARWLLWRRDLPSVVVAIASPGPEPPRASDESSQLRLGTRLGRVTSRCLSALPTDSRCLVRSVVLMALLARRGIASSLVIGVRPGEEFEAHAWVERDGQPLLPAGGGAYSRLIELGEQGRAPVS